MLVALTSYLRYVFALRFESNEYTSFMLYDLRADVWVQRKHGYMFVVFVFIFYVWSVFRTSLIVQRIARLRVDSMNILLFLFLVFFSLSLFFQVTLSSHLVFTLNLSKNPRVALIWYESMYNCTIYGAHFDSLVSLSSSLLFLLCLLFLNDFVGLGLTRAINSFIIRMLFTILAFRWVIYCAKKYSFAGSSNPEYSLHSFVQEYENGNENENANAKCEMENERNEWMKKLKCFVTTKIHSGRSNTILLFWCLKTQDSKRRQCFDCVSISFKCMQQTLAKRFEHAMNRAMGDGRWMMCCFVYIFFIRMFGANNSLLFFLSFFDNKLVKSQSHIHQNALMNNPVLNKKNPQYKMLLCARLRLYLFNLIKVQKFIIYFRSLVRLQWANKWNKWGNRRREKESCCVLDSNV